MLRKRERLGNVAALSALHNAGERMSNRMKLELFYTYLSEFYSSPMGLSILKAEFHLGHLQMLQIFCIPKYKNKVTLFHDTYPPFGQMPN